MANNHSLELREAIVTALLASAAVSAIVGSRVHGEEPPQDVVWPFIRYGLAIEAPYESSCGQGIDAQVTIHAFANGPGTDAIERLKAAIAESLDNAPLGIDPIGLVRIDWTGGQTLRDTAESSAYHGIVQFAVQTVEEE